MTKKVTEIPLERVKAEIDWVSRRAFASICFTDANFGIRKRDREIAEHLAACHAEQGRPAFCYFCLTKNNHRANLTTIEVFEEAGSTTASGSRFRTSTTTCWRRSSGTTFRPTRRSPFVRSAPSAEFEPTTS